MSIWRLRWHRLHARRPNTAQSPGSSAPLRMNQTRFRSHSSGPIALPTTRSPTGLRCRKRRAWSETCWPSPRCSIMGGSCRWSSAGDCLAEPSYPGRRVCEDEPRHLFPVEPGRGVLFTRIATAQVALASDSGEIGLPCPPCGKQHPFRMHRIVMRLRWNVPRHCDEVESGTQCGYSEHGCGVCSIRRAVRYRGKR